MPGEASSTTVGDALAAYQAHRYHRAQLIRALGELTWPPAPRTAGAGDDYLPNHPWDLIITAHQEGIVDDDLYDAILDSIEAHQPPH